jgi:signal transduction histidine kinase
MQNDNDGKNKISQSQYHQSRYQISNNMHDLSHDLKAPLRTIQSFSNLLHSKISGQISERDLNYLDIIQKNSQTMTLLVDDFLRFIEVESTALVKEEFDLYEFISLLISEFDFDKKQCTLETNNNQKINVLLDKSLLRIALLAIIDNCIKFKSTERELKIKIVLTDSKDGTKIEIIDNGIGIATEYLDKVFKMFGQLDPDVKGTGIGLNLCQSVMSKHGATMFIKSQIEEGTTVMFNFHVDHII